MTLADRADLTAVSPKSSQLLPWYGSRKRPQPPGLSAPNPFRGGTTLFDFSLMEYPFCEDVLTQPVPRLSRCFLGASGPEFSLSSLFRCLCPSRHVRLLIAIPGGCISMSSSHRRAALPLGATSMPRSSQTQPTQHPTGAAPAPAAAAHPGGFTLQPSAPCCSYVSCHASCFRTELGSSSVPGCWRSPRAVGAVCARPCVSRSW